jgi:hypothetical protein
MINDQAPDQGNTSVVPGSHRFLNSPGEYAGGNWRRDAATGTNSRRR